jgi:hypothetical protein
MFPSSVVVVPSDASRCVVLFPFEGRELVVLTAVVNAEAKPIPPTPIGGWNGAVNNTMTDTQSVSIRFTAFILEFPFRLDDGEEAAMMNVLP